MTAPAPLVDTFDSNLSSPRMRYYTLTTINAGDIDLVAEGGAPCREMVFIGYGSVVLAPVSPIVGDESGDVTDGLVLPGKVRAIRSTSSGFTGVWVLW